MTSIRRNLVTALGAFVFIGGVLSLLGWIINVPRLTDWGNYGITIKANTALCAIASGLALIFSNYSFKKWFIRTAGVFVSLIGGLTVLQHLTGLNFGIDTLLFLEPPGAAATTAPGRMGPPAALSFAMLGMAFLFSAGSSRARHWAAMLGMPVICVTSLSLVGYLYNADQLYTLPRLTGIALQTALMITAAGVGLIMSIPEHGIMKILGCDDAGGGILRGFLLPVAIVPLVLGWLHNLGREAGLYEMGFGSAVRTLLEIITLFGLVWWMAKGISRREEQLQASKEQIISDAEELKRANKELEHFTVIASHDLQEPLRKIMNYTEMLALPEEDEKNKEDYHRRIIKAASQMKNLIEALLEFSKIDKEMQLNKVHLKESVARAMEDLDAEKIAEMQIGELPTIEGDPILLKLLFQNLIGNSLKFRKKDESCRVSVSCEETEGNYVIKVNDNGIGFDVKYLDKIFQPFQRLHRKEEYIGTGIGLAACRKIVHRHKGDITADSKVGKGSTFIISLPIKRSF